MNKINKYSDAIIHKLEEITKSQNAKDYSGAINKTRQALEILSKLLIFAHFIKKSKEKANNADDYMRTFEEYRNKLHFSQHDYNTFLKDIVFNADDYIKTFGDKKKKKKKKKKPRISLHDYNTFLKDTVFDTSINEEYYSSADIIRLYGNIASHASAINIPKDETKLVKIRFLGLLVLGFKYFEIEIPEKISNYLPKDEYIPLKKSMDYTVCGVLKDSKIKTDIFEKPNTNLPVDEFVLDQIKCKKVKSILICGYPSSNKSLIAKSLCGLITEELKLNAYYFNVKDYDGSDLISDPRNVIRNQLTQLAKTRLHHFD